MFGIEYEVELLRKETLSLNTIADFKKHFVLRLARRYRQKIEQSYEELDQWLDVEIKKSGIEADDKEHAIALYAQLIRDDEERNDSVDKLTRWCVLASKSPEGISLTKNWSSFKIPNPMDFGKLVPIEVIDGDPSGRMQLNPSRFKCRDGFKLTDLRMNSREIQDEVNYCIYCHGNDGDFCSKGFPQKKGDLELGLKINPLREVLTGCPLEEKISEMHLLKREGRTIAALVMAMIDNPMIPATGHRIK